ncbi:hypothetical protein LXL04_007942 [Taraxacum kok-saghyz]
MNQAEIDQILRDPNEHGDTEIGRLSDYNQWGTMEMNEVATGDLYSNKVFFAGNDEELAADGDEAPMADFEANEHVKEQHYGNNTRKGEIVANKRRFPSERTTKLKLRKRVVTKDGSGGSHVNLQ